MQELGSRRPVEGQTLEERFAARLHQTLDDMAKGGFIAIVDRGLGLFDADGSDGLCILSVEDVARLLAVEARAWF